MDKDRIVENYRGHKLVARLRQSTMGVAIYTNDNKKLLIGELECASTEAAIQELRDKVDAELGGQALQAGDTPDQEKVVKALQSIVNDLPDSYIAMLKAHYHAPNRELTAGQLAEAAGFENYGAVNLHYGKLGLRLWEIAPCQLPKDKKGSLIYTYYLADGAPDQEPTENHRWVLKEPIARAIEAIGLHA